MKMSLTKTKAKANKRVLIKILTVPYSKSQTKTRLYKMCKSSIKKRLSRKNLKSRSRETRRYSWLSTSRCIVTPFKRAVTTVLRAS